MQFKRIFGLALAAMLFFLLPVTAFATQDDSSAQLAYVTDTANLLTDDQQMALETRAEELSREYEFSIYIIAVTNYRNYMKRISGMPMWTSTRPMIWAGAVTRPVLP